MRSSVSGVEHPEVQAEEFIFARNRRLWRYVRPLAAATTVGVGLWFGSLCWVLVKSPSLPGLDLRGPNAAAVARTGEPLGPEAGTALEAER